MVEEKDACIKQQQEVNTTSFSSKTFCIQAATCWVGGSSLGRHVHTAGSAVGVRLSLAERRSSASPWEEQTLPECSARGIPAHVLL